MQEALHCANWLPPLALREREWVQPNPKTGSTMPQDQLVKNREPAPPLLALLAHYAITVLWSLLSVCVHLPL